MITLGLWIILCLKYVKKKEICMKHEEILEQYYTEINNLPVDESVIQYIEKHKSSEYFYDIVRFCCDKLLNIIQITISDYTDELKRENYDIQLYLTLTKFIDNKSLSYYKAVAAFFCNDYKNVLKFLHIAANTDFFGNEQNPFTCDEFAETFIGPFKGAFPGFWEEIKELANHCHMEKGISELCEAVELYYSSKNAEEVHIALEYVLTINPDCLIAKELLGVLYYDMDFYGNAVACFEQIENPVTMPLCYVYFLMGFSYSKLKESKNEIEAYKKCVEIYEEAPYALNNLGFAYYKTKQFSKALICFKKCIKLNLDLKYSANNYVRTLIALHMYDEAEKFIKKSPVKIQKDLLAKVNKADKSSVEFTPVQENEKHIKNDVNRKINLAVKKQQFTSEKILEDELMLRLEKGLPIFDLNLKLYRRKGVYGRQFILPNNKRLDLLTEDNKGNLYIIELKKDSGYDDAYKQTAEYLEWFENNWNEHKNIYAIICCNSPSKELLEKVHKDKRIRIFEYQISYTEL